MGHPRILGSALAILAVGIALAALGGSVLVGESEDRDRLRNPRG